MGVILDLCSDAFLGLSAVARHIWMYVAKGKTPLEVASLLARRYEVEPGRLLPDVLHFIHMMQERGLLACCDEEWPAPPPPVETITLEGWGSDEIVALPLEIRDAREWQEPERREAFATLQRVDELLKQVGLKMFAHALMALPAHRIIKAEDAEVQLVADAVMEAPIGSRSKRPVFISVWHLPGCYAVVICTLRWFWECIPILFPRMSG